MSPSVDPLLITRDLTAAERKAMMHREGASEACMSWDVARSLYDRGLTLRKARFLRLTWLGASVRAALQSDSEGTASVDRSPEGGDTPCPGCGGIGMFHNHPCPDLKAGLHAKHESAVPQGDAHE